MINLNKVVKVAFVALTMMVGAQNACADDVTPEVLMENTKTPFGFATVSSRTTSTAYSITGGGAYTVSDVKALVAAGKEAGGSAGTTMVVDGKNVIVLESDGTKTDMAATIKAAIEGNDIIIFDGDHSLMGEKEAGKTNFYVDAIITLSGLSGKNILGMNGARLCTTWYLTDIIKSWLNSVETSSGSGVSNASTAAGTGGTIVVNGKEIAIDEEGEYLTRKTLVEKGEASKAKQDAGESLTAQDEENIKFLLTEAYRRSGVFYITNCSNLIIRNLSFQGPGSVDVGGYDLVAIINGTNHVWVDHCEFIDGQDGNFDITNESDFITASWCHFHYTDRSYVHQNTNLVGSNDKYDGKSGETIDDTGKLNITFAYNEWGENCRSRMPMARFGKIHMLNNWFNCPGNTENAINPRKQSEFLIDGNYFVSGITKTFKASESTGVTVGENTIEDPAASSITASGASVTMPYTYGKVASAKVPDMVELLVGPVLDIEPTYTVNPDDDTEYPTGQYTLSVSTDRAAEGLTFSVWADHAMTYQWYRSPNADLSGATAIDGATHNSYTYTNADEEEFYLYCVATGLAGTAQSNKIKIKIQGEGAPRFFTNITSYVKSAYTAITGTPFSGLSVYAGNNITCQWYRSETAVSDTTAVGVTKLVGKTEQTLTFTPTAEDKARESDYYFCVVRRPNDPTLFAISNIARVKYAAGAYLIKFIADLEEPDATDLQGITFCGKAAVATGNNGYKSNKQALKAIQLTSNYASGKADGTNSIKLSVAGGFKTGDKVTISGYYSNKDTKVTQVDLFTLGDKNAADTLATTGPVINGRTTDDDATTVEYELEADAEYLYLGRVGGTATNVSRILVSRGDLAEPVAPYIKTQPADVSDAMAKSASVLTIEAEDATNYAWYSNTSASTEGATVIDGQTTASCKYTPAAAGTTYVYCVVTNDPTGTGDPVKSVTSRFAEVVATPAINVPLDSLICFIADGNDPDANDLKGITRVDETNTIIAEVKYKTNSTALKVIQLSKSYSTGKVDGQYSVKLTCTGGFKKGDVITVAGYINSGDAAKYGAIDIFTLDGSNQFVGGKYLYRTENFIDGKIVDDDPVDYTYTLTEDANVVYLGRYGNTKTNISKILVTREKKFVEKAIYTTTFHDWTASSVGDKADSDVNTTHNAVTTTKENFKFKIYNTSVRPTDTQLNANSATTGALKAAKESTDARKATVTTDTITVNKISKIKFIHGAKGANRGWGLKVWGTQETGVRDADWVTVWSTTADTQRGTVVTVEGINRTNCKIQFYNLSKGEYAYMSDLVIYAMVEDKTCIDPTYETPAPEWQEATEKWRYTMTSTTESARLRYTLNGGDTQSVESNTVTLDLTPGTAVKVWAIDSNEELENSNEVTFTVKAQPKAAQPTITVGDVTMPAKTFPVTIAVTDGGTIHYTTDGSTPTASSPTYSAIINVAANATVKAINVKEHYANSNESQATTLALSNPTGDEQILISHNPHNPDGSINYSSNINKGVSYLVEATYNAGSYSSAENTGIKYNAGRDIYVGGVKKTGFQIDVNDGFVIKKLVIKNLCNNGTTGTAETINNIYADNSTTDIRGGEASDIVLPFSDKTPLEITLDNINARDSITFVCTPGSAKQIRAIVDVYYAIEEAPVSFTINGGEPISKDDFTDRVYSISAATATYEDNPTIVMTTTKGFQYTLQYEGAEKEGDKLSKFSYSILDEKWTVKVRVTGVNAPLISVDPDNDGLQFYKTGDNVIDGGQAAKGGYRVRLTDIKDEEGITAWITLDGGEEVQYDDNKEYYALKEVKARCKYNGSEWTDYNVADKDNTDAFDNDYSTSKPFAVYMYQFGYSDTGSGQEDGATASTWDKTKDQSYLGLTDKYNVIDLVLQDADQKKMINVVRPDIRNAKLVVISEMIGSKSPEAGSVYESSKLQDAMMSVRDSLIGYTNVLNMKMFFYSQSQNNNSRWAWAQPATLPNDKVSIMPTDAMYKVFEDVSFSRDGSVKLWSRYDEESTLNRLQLVHNFNEDNPELPTFTQLATATDDEGEVYDALHWFKKNGYQYIATGISINDYEHYDENLHNLVATIGEMINNDEDLDTKLATLPAPRIQDNGDGAATITNNNPAAPTYYLTSASANETWTAEEIRNDASAKTVDADYQTIKFESDVYVYAVTDVSGTLSATAKALVEGTHKRYLYRTTTDEGVTGQEAAYEFSTEEASAGNVTVPYNQSFSKPGYTVTSWKIKGSEPARYYTPGTKFAAMDNVQDVYLEAVWTENTHLITDAGDEETEAMRTVTWNFRQSDGAPALSLESGSTKLGQTGIIVGQMHFNDGTFIDVPMTIDASGSAVIPLSSGDMEGSAKFNNTSTNYVEHDFAQVRTGTKFSFPAVSGMTVNYVPTQFKKSTGENKYEVDETYVTMSTLTDGTLTLKPSNPGLATADNKITITDGIAAVATDNRATGGIFNYAGEATTATLTSIDAAQLSAPETGTTDNVVGSLNSSASVFMDKLTVTYPQLYDLSTEIILPESNDSISAEPQVKVELTAAKANCNGRYLSGTVLDITVTPSYSYYIENTDAVTFTPDAANLSKTDFDWSKDAETGVVTGKFTIQPNTVARVAVSQSTVRAYNVRVTPLSTGSVRVDSNTGKSEEEEYLKFLDGSTISLIPSPKVGYQFQKWVNSEGVEYTDEELTSNGVTKVGTPWRGRLDVNVNATNAAFNYVAVFIPGNSGTVTYWLPEAGLFIDETHYEQFGTRLFGVDDLNEIVTTDIPAAKQEKYKYTRQYEKYKFPVARTTTALYIPTNYTLYKEKDNESLYGYTLKNWVFIPGFDPEHVQQYYENKEEYQIGEYYYFDSEGDTRVIMPIFKKNEANFDYRTTTADITWDFRTAYRAQRLFFDETTEFDYATHTTINGGTVIDVPLHIKGKVDNTMLDEWCHFDDGTEITIPSGLGAKFTLVTYNKLSSTTIDGVVPTDYTMRTENNIPVYYYTYTTPSTATSVKLLIGKDHTYYKSIRAQLPSADKVDIITTVNNGVQGSSELLGAWSDAGKTVEAPYTSEQVGETDTKYTMALGSYVTVKATRNRLYELKGFMVDGELITAENAAEKGYTLEMPEGRGWDYYLTFRLFSYSTTVEAVFGNRQTWQITYNAGNQAYGEAPGVQVVEDGESFSTPTNNKTLYLEGYTLMKWLGDDGNEYEWNTSYTPTQDLYLSPVFEINDFTLFDLPAGYRTVTWSLITGDDATYGNGPLLKYQKSSGVTVAQLKYSDSADSQFIDMPLNINCTDAGKVDNSSTDYRCQVNSGSLMTLQTNANCKITLYTANGTLSTTKIAGSTSYTNNKYTGSIGESVNDNYVTVSYTGTEATQNIQFMGDASYFKMVKVEYGKVENADLPKLEQVTINNIALGSFGSPYEAYLLSTLKNNKAITIPVTLSTDARSMPKVKAAADKDDAIVSVTPATLDEPTATIILRDKNKATVGIYKIEFDVTYTEVAAPALQKVEMGGKLVEALDVNGDMQNYLEPGATMNVNGAISITFNQEMVAEDLTAAQTGGVNKPMTCAATNAGKTLVFSYWGLDVDKTYTFTIPAGTLYNSYEKPYNEVITFTFKTAATSQIVRHKNVNFVVTHSQSHAFNTADPTKNYNSSSRKQVASNELIANLQKAGIAYGTIDEGIELAHSASAAERYYIFVPDGSYQIKGNQQTDAIQSAGNGYAPADNNGVLRTELMGQKIYNGVTAIKRDNISITGQSMDKTKLWNKPEIEGISYTSTFFVNGASGFYVQDMTLQNAFDYKTCILKSGSSSAKAARAVVLRDRGAKTIMKNVTMDSWQDTYYSNLSNRYNDSRGYFEDCTIRGYVDFLCGDGDQWFERCDLILRSYNNNAVNMVAPSTYDNQLWGYVFNNCQITAEDDASYKANNGKFTLARPWKNSPATSFLGTKFNVLSTDDGYKQMSSSGLVLRMHEYGSTDGDGTLLDLSMRSLRASSPGAGSYSAVMTPAEAATYTVHNALGGADGYDPTLYTAQISMAEANLTSVDRSLSWDGQSEALCYFIFRKNTTGGYDLFAVTADSSYELDDSQIGKVFIVRAANQRGGLGEPSNEFTYEVHESFKLTLTEAQQAKVDDVMWSWSTIYLDYNAKAPTVADDNDEADAYVYAVINVTPTSMTLKRVKVLEKNQGYVVKGKPGTYTFSYTDSEGEYYTGDLSGAAYSDYTAVKADRMSILDGTVETVSRAGKEVYTLYYKANYGLGFYTYTGAYLNANKAYLDGSYVGSDGAGGIAIETQSSNSGFIFIDELGATDIQKVNNTVDDDAERIYTVYGQRVKRSEMIKGRVYIVNGRKLAY